MYIHNKKDKPLFLFLFCYELLDDFNSISPQVKNNKQKQEKTASAIFFSSSTFITYSMYIHVILENRR